MCGLYLGPRAKLLALTGSLLTLLCGMIVYWILLTNFLFHIGNFAHGWCGFLEFIPVSNASLSLSVSVCLSLSLSVCMYVCGV